jgi:hypothetical protein
MPDSFFTPIDIYCERLGPEFWAEPLNALSNGAFIVAAWLAWSLARQRATGVSLQSGVLIALVATIGVGSFLFHTLAVRWAMLADVIPISVYQLLFLVFYTRWVARLSIVRVVLCVAAFFAVSFAFAALPEHWLNGSLSYGSALVFILGMGLYHRRASKREPQVLLLAVAVFVVSLAFRSLDMRVCASLSVGTHAVWHVLNGVVLYLTTRGFVLNEAGLSSGHENRL